MAKKTNPRRPSRRHPKRVSKAPAAIGPAQRAAKPAKTYTSKPVRIDFAGPEHRFVRADLEIRGIYHGEASYEGRIFFNNSQADQKTPRTPQYGYAGSFYIFGHGGCLGDPGHCDVNEHDREAYDFRSPHPLTPAFKRVTVTKALRQLAASTKEVTITIVPVVTATNELCDNKNVFRCEDMRFLTYNG
jgi:tyrosinase